MSFKEYAALTTSNVIALLSTRWLYITGACVSRGNAAVAGSILARFDEPQAALGAVTTAIHSGDRIPTRWLAAHRWVSIKDIGLAPVFAIDSSHLRPNAR